MGGISPEYEQCIQTIAFEIFRAMLKDPPDWPAVTGEAGIDLWKEYSDKIRDVPNVSDIISKMGPSGAQWGAAVSIASVFAENGYSKGMTKVPTHRKISAKKYISEEPPSQQATSAAHQTKKPEPQQQ